MQVKGKAAAEQREAEEARLARLSVESQSKAKMLQETELELHDAELKVDQNYMKDQHLTDHKRSTFHERQVIFLIDMMISSLVYVVHGLVPKLSRISEIKATQYCVQQHSVPTQGWNPVGTWPQIAGVF